jgi:hypothetical protein
MTFKLNRAQGGATVREHLEAIERRTGERPKELDECKIPRELAHIWNWFLDMHGARTNNGFGWNPISYAEIFAWGRLMGERVRRHEARLLREMDMLFLAEAANGKE